MWRHAFSRSAAVRETCQHRFLQRAKPTGVMAAFPPFSSPSQADIAIVSRAVSSPSGEHTRCPPPQVSRCGLPALGSRREPCVASSVSKHARSTSEGLSHFTSSSTSAIVPGISLERRAAFVPKPGYALLSPVTHKYIEAELISGGQFAVITINRPDAKNALNREVLDELEACLNLVDAHAEKEPEFHALLIRSAVPGVFCGGADLKERADMSFESSKEFVDRLRSCFEHLSEVPYPTIACLHGSVMGGGLELALAADFRVASVRPPPSTLPPRDLFAPLPGPFHGSAKDDSQKPSQSASVKSRFARHQGNKKGALLSRSALDQVPQPSSSDSLVSRMETPDSLGSADRSSLGIRDESRSTAGVCKGELKESARQKAALATQSCSWCSSLELCLPEVSLGTMPGAGGTQRLWRVVGPQKAKLLLLTGGNVGPKQAVKWGLIDVMAGHNEDEVCKIWRFTPGLRRHKADRGEQGRGGNEREEKQVAQRIVLDARRNRFESRQARAAEQQEETRNMAGEGCVASGDGSQRDTEVKKDGSASLPKKSTFETAIPDNEWESEDAFRVGIRLACRLASLAPLSVRATKKSANSAVGVSIKEGLKLEGKVYDSVLSSEDRDEGLRAFKERRKPKYKGK